MRLGESSWADSLRDEAEHEAKGCSEDHVQQTKPLESQVIILGQRLANRSAEPAKHKVRSRTPRSARSLTKVRS